MRELIEELCSVFGPSGQEEKIREAISRRLEGLVDALETDRLGNLIGRRAPTSGGTGGKRVMLAAHMDEIGVMITHVDAQGFCRFAPLGGVLPNALPGGRVVFANGVEGAFGQEGSPLARERPSLPKMFLDVGATGGDDAKVQVGDTAVFRSGFGTVAERIFAPNLDDRIGCAVLLQTLRELGESPHEILAVFTAQEEVGARGARTAGYALEPEVVLAIDVTATGDFPEAHPMDVSLGKGPAIKVMDRGMIAHPGVRRWLEDAARQNDLPYQLEVLELGSTDASTVQVGRGGVPAGAVSIPCRYVHTPSQVADCGDARLAVDLLVKALGAGTDPLSSAGSSQPVAG